MKKKYVLVIDDTSFDQKARKSEYLQNERYTFCGLLFDQKYLANYEYILGDENSGLIGELNKRYNTTEFHFTDIVNHKGKFSNIELTETLEILDAFSEIIAMQDLPIITFSLNSLTPLGSEKVKDIFSKFAGNVNLPKSGKDLDKTISLALCVLKANNYAKSHNGEIVHVICDEGLRKNTATSTFNLSDKPLTIEFASSESTPIIQLADFAAYSLTRRKIIIDKRAGTDLAPAEKQMLKSFEKMNDNFIDLPQVELDQTIPEYDDVIAMLAKENYENQE